MSEKQSLKQFTFKPKDNLVFYKRTVVLILHVSFGCVLKNINFSISGQ